MRNYLTVAFFALSLAIGVVAVKIIAEPSAVAEPSGN